MLWFSLYSIVPPWSDLSLKVSYPETIIHGVLQYWSELLLISGNAVDFCPQTWSSMLLKLLVSEALCPQAILASMLLSPQHRREMGQTLKSASDITHKAKQLEIFLDPECNGSAHPLPLLNLELNLSGEIRQGKQQKLPSLERVEENLVLRWPTFFCRSHEV